MTSCSRRAPSCAAPTCERRSPMNPGRRLLAHRQHDIAPLLPRVDDLEQRVARALAPDVLGEHVVAARHGAARVAVVALGRGEEQQHALVVEHRAEHVEVGEVPTPVVRVVGDDHVARMQLAGEELTREAHRQRGREHELRDADGKRGQTAVTGEDRGVALVRLVEDARRRSPRHVGGHLEADGLHRRAHHDRRHRIDRAHWADASSSTSFVRSLRVAHSTRSS
jgi:hypothetical protein